MPNEMAKMMRVRTTATAAADPTRPCWNARLYTSKDGTDVLWPGPPRVVT